MYQVKRLGCYVLLARTGPITVPMPRFIVGFYKTPGYCLPMFAAHLKLNANKMFALYPVPRAQS